MNRPNVVPPWVLDRLAAILPGYSGPITLDCRDGRIKRVVPVVVYTEPEAARGRTEDPKEQSATA